MSTAYSQMYPGDVNFLDSVESFMMKSDIPTGLTPQENLAITDQARATLYSYDVQCMPRVADKILQANMDIDQEARGLWIAFYNHSLDPIFVKFLMQYLHDRSDTTLNGKIGALLTKVIGKYVEDHLKKEKTDGKKSDKKDPKEKKEGSDDILDNIKHIEIAVEKLLGSTAITIEEFCGNLSHADALYIASCIAMSSQETITEILNSDLPITADLFNEFRPYDPLVMAALRLRKSEVPLKPTANQTAFLESLKRWVFDKLDTINGGAYECYKFLVYTYGSVKPDVSPYYIQIKDCGTIKPNLIQAAKQIVNSK